MLRVKTSDALARLGVFREALPVVGNTAGVELVVEDSVTALPVAIDRRGIPLAFAPARDGLTIEARGDLPGRHHISVLVG